MMLISVDTGNRCIKVPDIAPFTAGLYCNGAMEPISSGETLFYNGQYYTLTESRAEYRRDKTKDDTYFILTLFAMAKRICAKQPGATSYDKDVVLAVGLPPSHCSPEMKEKYKAYFSNMGKPIHFEYNGIPFTIRIAYPQFDTDPNALYDPAKCGVLVYAQGYSAAILRKDEIIEYPESYVIDIGGYTTDVIKLTRYQAKGRNRLKVDMSFCRSFDMGVIHLHNDIIRLVTERVGDGLSETIIDAMMQGSCPTFPAAPVVKEIIEQQCLAYAQKIVQRVEENGASLNFAHPVFIGGGAATLKKYLNRIRPELEHATVIPSITANAEGYAKMAKVTLENNHIALEEADFQGAG